MRHDATSKPRQRRRGRRALNLIIAAPTLLLTAALSLGGCGSAIDRGAAAKLESALGSADLTVYAAFVRQAGGTRYDLPIAERLAAAWTESGYGRAAAVDAHVPITGQIVMNQAAMLHAAAREFGAYVRANPAPTEYVLLCEFLLAPTSEREAMGLMVYLVDKQGRVAYASLSNSHHPAWQRVKPKTADDCATIVIDVWRDDLRAAKKSERPPG